LREEGQHAIGRATFSNAILDGDVDLRMRSIVLI
jgi:hypothetical protein